MPPHDLTDESFSVCSFSHTKSCLSTVVWPTRRTAMRVHCQRRPSTQLLTYMDVFEWKCSHGSTRLHTTCHTISYVVFDRHVSTQCVYYETHSCACLHIKRRLSVHFLTYEVMPMRNFKHITPCLSHIFPQVHSKQSNFLNLRTFLTMHLLTYKDVSMRKLSHRRTCLVQHVT